MESFAPAPSPRIIRVKWGLIEVEKFDEDGKLIPKETVTYRDAKLWPGGSEIWDWRQHGTSHRLGIALEDVLDLHNTGAKIVVLSMGKMCWLHIPHHVLNGLQQSGHVVIVEPTSAAVKTYNNLVEHGHLVAGLFHTTC
ncbi:unnamed protein product [Mesocestoides corti]|uniref:AcnX domain-containing protein n=1 Tax=Mesocestoides corti TaxID=53468 RepID=A0A0R3U1Q1_MESCO|nr:unnamed protein product [Mesocestoides corti]